jgi:hypothetical protein
MGTTLSKLAIDYLYFVALMVKLIQQEPLLLFQIFEFEVSEG